MPGVSGPRYGTRYGWNDGENSWGDSDAEGGANANRLKFEATLWPSVPNFSTNAPPGSPGDLDTYVIGNAGSGDWSGHNFNFTYYTSNYGEWRFLVPLEGATVWNQALKQRMVFRDGRWGPENFPTAVQSVATAPPGSPTAGNAYLIDPVSATGAFAGHLDNVAFWTGGNWQFWEPDFGLQVWDISNAAYTHYDGTAWV